jgi:hypothetical protein
VLIALNGVAQDVAGVINDQLVAGLWKTGLIEDMCWVYHDADQDGSHPCGIPCRPSKWRAPTWSWASIRQSHDRHGYNRQLIGQSKVLWRAWPCVYTTELPPTPSAMVCVAAQIFSDRVSTILNFADSGRQLRHQQTKDQGLQQYQRDHSKAAVPSRRRFIRRHSRRAPCLSRQVFRTNWLFLPRWPYECQ